MWIPKTFLHAYKWLEIYVGMCRSCDALLSVCSCPRRRHQSLLAVFFFYFFSLSLVTRGQEIWAWPWAQSHLGSLDVMAVCRDANRWISDKNTGAPFPIHFLLFSPTRFSLVSVFLLRSDSFPRSRFLPLSSSPTLSRLPVKTGGDPGCLVSGTSAAGCSDNRENFFYFIWVSHLCTSPIECEIGEVGRTEPARGFRHRWQGSYASPKNCVPALLWLLVNFQPFYQRCYKNSILKALSVGEIESDAKKNHLSYCCFLIFRHPSRSVL